MNCIIHYSFIQGANNKINNQNNQVDITNNGGSVIVGSNNKILNISYKS